jgi:small conductance mechanosensitive channel
MPLLSSRRGYHLVGIVVAISVLAQLGEEPSAAARPLAQATRAASGPSAVAAAAPSAAARSIEKLNGTKGEVIRLRKAFAEDSGERRDGEFGALIDASSRYRRQLTHTAAVLVEEPALEGTPEERAVLASLVGSELSAEAEQIGDDVREGSKLFVGLIEESSKAKDGARLELDKRRNRVFSWLPVLLTDFRDNLVARALSNQDTKADITKFRELLTVTAASTNGALRRVKSEIAQIEPAAGTKLDATVQGHLDALTDFQTLLIEAQRKMVSYMDDYGLDTVQLRQDLITTTGQVSREILDPDVMKGLLEEWTIGARRWASEHAGALVFRLFSLALILFACGLLARVAKSLVRRALARGLGHVSGLASDFFIASAGRIVWVLGLVIAAAQLGIEVGPLLAGLGIAGFVAGFALQDTLSNFAAGMMILIYRPFDVGDHIEAGGVSGVVKTMTLVYTSVITLDNQMLVVPNGKIWGGVIRNLTHQAERRVDLQFNVSYRDDVAHAERVLSAVLRDNPRVLAEPAPLVRLHELSDSCARFVVRPWVKTADYWEAYWEITREVKLRFDAEGLIIPFPQRDLHVYEERHSERAPIESDVVPARGAAR